MSRRSISRQQASSYFAGRTVAIVGSGPGVARNAPGIVDAHEVVVRVNNYKLVPGAGARTDVFYSFFGASIRKTAAELQRDGVKLCYCKCPDAKFIDSEWHARHRKMNGVDFRYIYRQRADWWFGPVYVPSIDEFMAHFTMLGNHVPTTGFSALLDVLSHGPRSVFMTGFDFFQSGVHNVNERWRAGDPTDPIGHDPRAERAWFIENARRLPIKCDAALEEAVAGADWKAPPKQPPRTFRRKRYVPRHQRGPDGSARQ